jgi:chloride channel 3/4/5
VYTLIMTLDSLTDCSSCFDSALLSFSNQYTRMSGTELVLSLFCESSVLATAAFEPALTRHSSLLSLAECTLESTSHLCVSQPEQIGSVVSSILLAMLVKGGLTVITFGIKLPGPCSLLAISI